MISAIQLRNLLGINLLRCRYRRPRPIRHYGYTPHYSRPPSIDSQPWYPKYLREPRCASERANWRTSNLIAGYPEANVQMSLPRFREQVQAIKKVGDN